MFSISALTTKLSTYNRDEISERELNKVIEASKVTEQDLYDSKGNIVQLSDSSASGLLGNTKHRLFADMDEGEGDKEGPHNKLLRTGSSNQSSQDKLYMDPSEEFTYIYQNISKLTLNESDQKKIHEHFHAIEYDSDGSTQQSGSNKSSKDSTNSAMDEVSSNALAPADSDLLANKIKEFKEHYNIIFSNGVTYSDAQIHEAFTSLENEIESFTLSSEQVKDSEHAFHPRTIGKITTALYDYEVYIDPNVAVNIHTTSANDIGVDQALMKKNAQAINIIGRAKVPEGKSHQMRHVVPVAFIEKGIENSIKDAISAKKDRSAEESQDVVNVASIIGAGEESHEAFIDDNHSSEEDQTVNSATVSKSSTSADIAFKLMLGNICDLVQVDDFGIVLKPSDLSKFNQEDRQKYKNIIQTEILNLKAKLSKLFKDYPSRFQGMNEHIDRVVQVIVDNNGIIVDKGESARLANYINDNDERLKKWNDDKRNSIVQNICNKILPYLKENPIQGTEHLANLLLAEFNKHSTAAFPTEGNSQNKEARVGYHIKKGTKVDYQVVTNDKDLKEARRKYPSRLRGPQIEEALVANEGARIHQIMTDLSEPNQNNSEIAALLYEAFDYKKLEDQVFVLKDKKLQLEDGKQFRQAEKQKAISAKKYTEQVKFRSEIEDDEYLAVAMNRFLAVSFSAFPDIKRKEVLDEFILCAQKNYEMNINHRTNFAIRFKKLYQQIKDETPERKLSSVNANAHLVRFEKNSMSEVKKTKFKELLSIGLNKQELEILNNINTTLENTIPEFSSSTSSSSKAVPTVTLLAENNHKINHKTNIVELTNMIDSMQIKPNTVICLERKEGGKNFGMKDVMLLASIVKHNKAAAIPIPISEAIKESLIYQDALLYNKAKEHGIKVVGIEGKSLAHDQHSLSYNKGREDFMASKINQLTETGNNVIVLVGSSHVSSLEKKLTAKVTPLKTKAKRMREGFSKNLNAAEPSFKPAPVISMQNKKNSYFTR